MCSTMNEDIEETAKERKQSRVRRPTATTNQMTPTTVTLDENHRKGMNETTRTRPSIKKKTKEQGNCTNDGKQ